MKILFPAALAFVFLCGCETTGDPHQGGIFWSERKAQERLYQKRAELRAVESDTARKNRSSNDDY
jgi:hypothetical protein